MAQVMKHVGKVGEKPCVVIFREVPTEPENALVVKTSNLTDEQHDALMNVVQSAEAQEANEVSEVLHRRQFPDGTNMLTALHTMNKIEKVATDLVMLTPVPGQSVPLTEVNVEINKIKNNSNPPLKTEVDPVSVDTSPLPNEVVDTTATTDNGSEPESVAQNILFQADLMIEDANRMLAEAEAKREEAYALDPSLKPKKGPGRPKKS